MFIYVTRHDHAQISIGALKSKTTRPTYLSGNAVSLLLLALHRLAFSLLRPFSDFQTPFSGRVRTVRRVGLLDGAPPAVAPRVSSEFTHAHTRQRANLSIGWLTPPTSIMCVFSHLPLEKEND